MGVVAAHAVHLPLAERHVGRPHQLGLALDVALGARVDHRGLGALASLGDLLHHPMAVGAGHFTSLVRAPLPEEAGGLLVALEADGVPLVHGGGVLLAERDEPADALSTARFNM